MPLDAGTVIAFFEGQADQLFKVIETIEKKLNDLSKKTFDINVSFPETLFPVAEITKSFDAIEKRLADVSKQLQDVGDFVVNSSRRVASSVQDVAADTIDRVAQTSGKGLETIISRSLLLGAGAVGYQIFAKVFTEALNSDQLGTVIRVGFLNNFDSITKFLITRVATLSNAFGSIFSKSISSASYFVEILQRGASILPLIGSSSVLFLVPFVLKEALSFIKKIKGEGTSGLGVVEKLSRLVSFITDAVELNFFRAKALFSFFALSISTYWIPFYGQLIAIPALLNLVTGGIVNTFKLVATRTLAAFGSGRAALTLIINNIKSIGLNLLPIIDKATKGTKLIELNTKQIPILGQFKSFKNEFESFRPSLLFTKAQVFLREVVVSLNELKGIFIASTGLADSTVAKIKQNALSAFGDVEKEVISLDKRLKRGVFASFVSLVGKVPGAIAGIFRRSANQRADIISRGRIGSGGEGKDLQLLESSKKFADTIKNNVGKGIDFAVSKFNKFAEIGKTAIAKANEELAKQPNYFALSRKEIEGLTKELLTVEGPISKIFRGSQKSGPLIAFLDRLSTFRAAPTIQNFELIVKNIDLLYNSFKRISQEKGLIFSPESSKSLEKFGNNIKSIQESLSSGTFKTGDLSNLIKEFDKLAKLFSGEKLSQLTQSNLLNVLGNLSNKIVSTISKAYKAGEPLSGKFISGLSKTLSSVFSSRFVKLPFADFVKKGYLIAKNFAIGLLGGKKDVEKAALGIVDGAADYTGRSLPKKGPLKNIIKSGTDIGKFLASGMDKAKSIVASSANKLAQNISDYFPQSPAKLGPLKKILQAGKNIGKYIADGLKLSYALVKSVVEKLAQIIISPVEDAAEIGFLSERTGIAVENLSSLDFALRSVGSRVQDLEYSFGSFQDILSRTLTKEEQKKFEKLGLDLDKIKNSNDPVLSLFYDLSDAIQGLSGKELQDALNLFGITAQSKIVNVLKLGSEEIIRLQKEGVDLGIVFDKSFTDAAKKAKSLQERLKQIKERFFDNLAIEVIPFLNELGEKVTNFLVKNRTNIQTFITLVGRGIRLLGKIIVELFVLISNNPGKVFDIIKSFLASAASLLVDSLKGIGNLILDNLAKILDALFAFVRDAVFGFIGSIFKKLGLQIFSGIADLYLQFLNKIIEVVESIPEDVKEFIPGFDTFIAGFKQVKDATANLFSSVSGDIKSVGEIIAAALSDASFNLEVIFDQLGDIGEKLFDEDSLEKAKKRLEIFISEIKDSVEGTKFEPLLDQIIELFSSSNFEQIKLGIEKQKQEIKKAIDETRKASSITTNEEDEEKALEKVKKLNQSILSGLSEAFAKAFRIFFEKGKIAVEQLSEIAGELFQKTFSDLLNNLKSSFEELLAKALSAIGAGSELASGILTGIVAIGALLLSRLKSSAEVTNKEIISGVEEVQEKVRGVVAGPTQVGIQEVATRLITANIPVVLRLDRIIEILTQIRDSSGGIVQNTAQQNFGLLESI